MEVFWTALVGIAGIAATFFAPPWTQRQIARRNEAREFRRARRLVAFELRSLATGLDAAAEAGVEVSFPPEAQDVRLPLREWQENKSTLAFSLADELWDEISDVYEKAQRFRAVLSLDVEPGRPLRTHWPSEMSELAGRARDLADQLAVALALAD